MTNILRVLPFLVIIIIGCIGQDLNDQKTKDTFCPIDDVILESPLRIGAWNVQKLGKTKLSKTEVVKIIVQVMLKFDIILIEEIMDSTQTVPYEILELLNDAAYYAESNFDPNDVLEDRAENIYEIVISDRIGRSRYKEQYAFYYRTHRVAVNETYQFEDKKDVFQVEPFVVVFELPDSDIERLALVPIHTSPDDAVQEIDALVDVYDEIVGNLGIEDVIILGDYNAGCTYVRGDDWLEIRLRTDDKFLWLIDDHTDTTTKGTTCPYDRIVIAGSALKKAVYEESAKPYYFYEEFDIDDDDFIHDVSDHYPVEVSLRGSTQSLQLSTKVEISISVDVLTTETSIEELEEHCEKVIEDEKRIVSFNLTHNLDKDATEESFDSKESLVESEEHSNEETTSEHRDSFYCGQKPRIVASTDDIFVLEFLTKNIEEASQLLEGLAQNHPCVFTPQATSILKYKMGHEALADTSVYYEGLSHVTISIRLFCLRQMCKIFVAKQTPVI